jgi:hypothetical protein
MGSRKEPFDALLVLKNNRDRIFTRHNIIR